MTAVAYQGSPQTITLPAGHLLSITADSVSSGRVWPFAQRLGDSPGLTSVAAGETKEIGPYAVPTRYQVEALSGSLSYSADPVDYPTLGESDSAADALATAAKEDAIEAAALDATAKADAAEAAAALDATSKADAAQAAAIANAATKYIQIIDGPGDLREASGSGIPDVSAKAAATVNPAGDDNSLTFTAKAFGPAGNDISVAYADPAANESPLSVDVDGSAIVVNLETDAEGAIVSTAADVLAAIEADEGADALVDVEIDATDSGLGDDGSGVVTAMVAANLTGGTGVGVGVAGKGSRYTDISAGTLYLNTGTKAEPEWTQLAPVVL